MTVAKKGEAPYNELVLRPIPQWKDFGVKDIDKKEIKVGEQADTIAAYFPYNLQMTPVLDITDPMGGNLVSIYTDNTYAAGDINLRAEYITAPGQQTYESKGWLNGHILYIVAPKGVTVNKISYRGDRIRHLSHRQFQLQRRLYQQILAEISPDLVCQYEGHFLRLSGKGKGPVVGR